MRIKFEDLADFPVGFYKIAVPSWQFWRNDGYISVDTDADGGKTYLWTSHKTTHDRLGKPAIAISVEKDGTLWLFQQSAISMHIAWASYKKYASNHELLKAIDAAAWFQKQLPNLTNIER